MRPECRNAHEHAGRNRDNANDAMLFQRSLSMRLSLDSQTTDFSHLSSQRGIGRSSSLGRVRNIGSWRRSSSNLSRDDSTRILQDIPCEIIAQVGDSGDRVMDDRECNGSNSGVDELKQDSFGRMSRRDSWGKGSISFSRDLEDQILGDVVNGVMARVGDSGDRVVQEDTYNGSGSLRFELDNVKIVENGRVSVPDDAPIQSNGFWFRDEKSADHASPVSPLTSEILSPLPTDAILYSRENNLSRSFVQISQNLSLKEKQYKLPRLLDYIAYMLHLAVFGIFGVVTRYLLQKLFGPGRLALTSDQTSLYLDLPANMAGSFFMGWFGLVFKGDVRHISDHLAIGLATGYMGSLTTFSGWNQKMLDLSSKSHWVFAVAGIILGLFLVNESFRVGVESAQWLRRCIWDLCCQGEESTTFIPKHWRVDRPGRHIAVTTVMLLILGLLWGVSGALARARLDPVTNGAVLWLGCLVGPPGVWLRWYLARLNGQGLGKKGLLKWLPIGTLAANVLAACIMAALATMSKVVNTKRSGIILSGVQFGFLGCLSTVSTFVAEIYAMRQSGHPGRALAYAAATFIPSFAVGTLIYSVPVWTKHYN